MKEMTPAQVDTALTNAHEAWTGWRRTSFAQRAELMGKVASLLRERARELARLVADGLLSAADLTWAIDHALQVAGKPPGEGARIAAWAIAQRAGGAA